MWKPCVNVYELVILWMSRESTEYCICEGNGTPLQYCCLENPMDGGAWWAAVHGVAKSQTRLSDFTFTFHFHALEKEMATHSSVLAWRIPGTGKPGGLQSMGSHRVGHNWSDAAAAAAAITVMLCSKPSLNPIAENHNNLLFLMHVGSFDLSKLGRLTHLPLLGKSARAWLV